MTEQEFEEHRVRVTDKRRVDPETNEVRQPLNPAGAPGRAQGLADALQVEEVEAEFVEGEVGEVELKLAELTADLQRVHAEYANYRKRVDRDRELVRDQAVAAALGELLTVLDDIDRAGEHGELVGGFRSVADGLQAAVTKLGLERYGEAGDAFDPAIHEAMTHSFSDEVEQTTCLQVFQPGYRHADRVIRPARVAVVEPGQAD